MDLPFEARTSCRSPTYRSADLPWDTEFPYIAQLSKLTRLELASNFGGGSLSDMLSGLTDLKDLTLSSEGSLEPLVLPSAAEVTKLTVAGSLVRHNCISIYDIAIMRRL